MQDISKASSFCKPHVISTASHSSLRAGLTPWAYTYSYLLTWLSHTLDGKVTKTETISYLSLILSLALDTVLVSQQAFNKYLLKQIDWLIHTAAAAAKLLQSCQTLCDPTDGSPPGSPRPWDSPGKNTGVGCHFLLQCMKVKNESEVVQSCPTLSNPMDCSLPGSAIHGIFQARVLESGAINQILNANHIKICILKI